MEFILSLIFILLLFIVPTIICIAPGLILAAIIINLIRKKLIKKDEKIKSFIYAIVIFFCVLVSMTIGNSFLLYESAKPDEQYIEMNEINDNQSLVGLSKEQVVELLGKPDWAEDERTYYYDAGKVTNYLLFGLRDSYELRVVFDENYIVISTSIRKVA